MKSGAGFCEERERRFFLKIGAGTGAPLHFGSWSGSGSGSAAPLKWSDPTSVNEKLEQISPKKVNTHKSYCGKIVQLNFFITDKV